MRRWGIALIAGVLGATFAGMVFADPPAPAASAPAAAAMPAADPMEGTYGNTVKLTGKDGDYYYYFNRDGTFTSSEPNGEQFGTWKIVGDKVCTHTKAGESCGVVQPNRKVGDKWSPVVNGEAVQVEIIAGR